MKIDVQGKVWGKATEHPGLPQASPLPQTSNLEIVQSPSFWGVYGSFITGAQLIKSLAFGN